MEILQKQFKEGPPFALGKIKQFLTVKNKDYKIDEAKFN